MPAACEDDSCSFVPSDVGCDEAQVILEPYFLAAQERFILFEMEHYGSSRMRKVRLECSAKMHDTPRHFAGTTEDGRLIMTAPQLVELPEETVVGILAHEFGHAMDFAYPARFVMLDGGLVERDLEGPKAERALVAAARQWRDRDDDTVERTADAIAEEVTGHVIGYGGPCMLQRFDSGTIPRPKGLR